MITQSIQFPFTKYRQDIGALPGVSRWGTSSVVDFLKQPVADGLSSVLLFGVPDKVWRQIPGAVNSVADMEIHSFRWRREKMELQENAKKTLLWRRWGASFLCDLRSLEELSEQKRGSDQKEPVNQKRERVASVHCIYQEKFLKKGAEAEMEEEYDLTHMMWNKRLLDWCWKG